MFGRRSRAVVCDDGGRYDPRTRRLRGVGRLLLPFLDALAGHHDGRAECRDDEGAEGGGDAREARQAEAGAPRAAPTKTPRLWPAALTLRAEPRSEPQRRTRRLTAHAATTAWLAAWSEVSVRASGSQWVK